MQVAIGSEKPQAVDYMPGEALRLAVYDGNRAESSELLGSCVVECSRFWPQGFEGQVQLEEQGRREKKSVLKIKAKRGHLERKGHWFAGLFSSEVSFWEAFPAPLAQVTTPDSMLPYQFAAEKREPGTFAQERFEAEMKELRARMPFLSPTATWQ